MTNKKQNNDAMPSKGVRLRVDQWEDCDKYYYSKNKSNKIDKKQKQKIEEKKKGQRMEI